MNTSCKICDNTFSSYRRLCKHVRDVHKLTSQTYYDQHLRCDGEGVCEYCGNSTKFETIALGYRSSCKSCKSQKAKDLRSAQKKNAEKQSAFVAKVRDNQKRIWQERKETGEEPLIRAKIGQTIKSNNNQLTDKELANKYGWLNRLTLAEKEQWKNDVMFNTGCHAWWKQATEADTRRVVSKRMATKSRVSQDLIEQSLCRPEEYRAYAEAVWYITQITYSRFKNLIDPDNLRGPNWHLDHIYSVKVGFINNVDPQVIGSVHNLRIISSTSNIQKNIRCDIELEELLGRYYEQV
jgi:hypothetical protein